MKTPKRKHTDDEPALFSFGYGSPNQTADECARWKRKNRVKQLKNTISRLQKQLTDMDVMRSIARKQLGRMRDFLLLQSRACKMQKHRAELLQYVGNCNLFLTLSMSPDELDREFAGEDVRPYKLQLTEEERKIIRPEDDMQP